MSSPRRQQRASVSSSSSQPRGRDFDLSFAVVSRPSKAGFGPPPRLRTRTGDIGVKTKMDRLLAVANGLVDGEERRTPPKPKQKVTRGEFDCPLCKTNYRVRSEFEAHERACRILSKGHSRVKSRVELGDPHLSFRGGGGKTPFDCDDEDALNALLTKTSMYASTLRSDRRAGYDERDDDDAERQQRDPLEPDFFAFLDGGAGGFGSAFGRNLHGARNQNNGVKASAPERKDATTGRTTSAHFDKVYEESRRMREEKENEETEEEDRWRKRAAAAGTHNGAPTGAVKPFDFEQHEILWSKFEVLVKTKLERREQLTYADVPFPTFGAGPDLFGATRLGDAERKTHIRKLLLRWHPDRWLGALHAPLFGEADFARVMDAVTDTSQKINGAKKFENDLLE